MVTFVWRKKTVLLLLFCFAVFQISPSSIRLPLRCFKRLMLQNSGTSSSECGNHNILRGKRYYFLQSLLCSLALKLNIPYSLSLFCICSANPPRDALWVWDIICLLPVIDRFTGRLGLVQMNTKNATIHPQQSVFNCMYSNITACILFSCCHLAFWVKSKGKHRSMLTIWP